MQKYFALLIFFSLLAGCKQEHINPVYKTEELHLHDVKINLDNSIPMSVIEPDAFRKIMHPISWIPIVGGIISTILEFPINLTLAIFPPLSSISNPQLPKNAQWNDPEFLKSVGEIKLESGSIRITPKELRGPNYKPEICPGFPMPVECPDTEFDSFLKEIRVYLTFKKDPNNPLPASEPEYLLARAEIAKDYNKETQTLKFNMMGFDLRPLMDKFDRFEAKIIATGVPPSHKVYMDGKLNVSLVLKLSD